MKCCAKRPSAATRSGYANTLLALVALAAAVGGCAAMTAEEPPATSTIRELTIRSSAEASGTATSSGDECAAMLWPVDGTLSSPFGAHDGRRHEHEGIDVAVAEDTPVRAACDGLVTYAGNGLRGYGNVVIVQHADGLATLYAHNRALEVRQGELVTRGQDRSRARARAATPAGRTCTSRYERARIARDPLGYLSHNEQSGEHRRAY